MEVPPNGYLYSWMKIIPEKGGYSLLPSCFGGRIKLRIDGFNSLGSNNVVQARVTIIDWEYWNS